jgi:hypothetical protein
MRIQSVNIKQMLKEVTTYWCTLVKYSPDSEAASKLNASDTYHADNSRLRSAARPEWTRVSSVGAVNSLRAGLLRNHRVTKCNLRPYTYITPPTHTHPTTLKREK